MKHVFAAAVMTAMLAGPAYPQMNLSNKDKSPLQLQYEREEQERRDNEKAYNETMKRLKSQAPTQARSDPWAGVRPLPESNAKR
jgi:hypothetical protein